MRETNKNLTELILIGVAQIDRKLVPVCSKFQNLRKRPQKSVLQSGTEPTINSFTLISYQNPPQ